MWVLKKKKRIGHLIELCDLKLIKFFLQKSIGNGTEYTEGTNPPLIILEAAAAAAAAAAATRKDGQNKKRKRCTPGYN